MFRFKSAMMAAAVVMTVAAATQAVTVTYSSDGSFGTAIVGGGVVSNGGNRLTVGDFRIDFADRAQSVSVDPLYTESNLFGSFTVTRLGLTNTVFSHNFSLAVTQSAPVPGGTITASGIVLGILTATTQGISVTFGPFLPTNTITGVTYIVQNPTGLSVPDLVNGSETTNVSGILSYNSNADPNAPLPPAAWAGLTLLGSVGLAKVRRARRTLA